MSFTATVEKDTIRLPEGVHVPDGTRVEISFSESSGNTREEVPTLFELLEPFVGCIKDGPSDLAAEHDHYAHGAPKRGT